MSDIFIPICVYYNSSGQGKIENASIDKSCPQKDGEWNLHSTFYAINPMFRPIPTFMYLFCAKKSDDYPFKTEEVKYHYDPYHVIPECIGFITWSQPVPYTSPLHIYYSGDTVLPSFSDKPPDGWEISHFSPLYVLTKQPTSHTIFIGDRRDWFNIGTDGHPQFKFISYHGRCIPDPQGNDFLDCSLYHDINHIGPTSLLDYLSGIGDENKSTTYLLFFVIILIVIFCLLFLSKKRK